MMLPSDTQETEEQIRHPLLVPYSDGSISIATEDIQISQICELGSDSIKVEEYNNLKLNKMHLTSDKVC